MSTTELAPRFSTKHRPGIGRLLTAVHVSNTTDDSLRRRRSIGHDLSRPRQNISRLSNTHQSCHRAEGQAVKFSRGRNSAHRFSTDAQHFIAHQSHHHREPNRHLPKTEGWGLRKPQPPIHVTHTSTDGASARSVCSIVSKARRRPSSSGCKASCSINLVLLCSSSISCPLTKCASSSTAFCREDN